jgi:hypothetical protein
MNAERICTMELGRVAYQGREERGGERRRKREKRRVEMKKTKRVRRSDLLAGGLAAGGLARGLLGTSHLRRQGRELLVGAVPHTTKKHIDDR